VAQHGETVVVPDTAKDTDSSEGRRKNKNRDQSIVAVPVKVRDTSWRNRADQLHRPEGFDPRDLKLLEALSDFAAIALENARHVKRIHELTIKDDCTSLYNARHMSFILERKSTARSGTIRVFDRFYRSRSFQAGNDTHGHLVGSRLLAEIGNALKSIAG